MAIGQCSDDVRAFAFFQMREIFEKFRQRTGAKVHAGVVLVFLALLTLPIGRVVELPTLLMAIGGIWLLVRQTGKLFEDPAQKLYLVLFLTVWVPMLISLIGAVNLSRSLIDVLPFIRLYLAGVFVIAIFAEPARQALLIRLAALLLAFWLVDAVVQALRGVDMFGHQYVPGRLNAVYGERHLDFGVALPMLAPLLLYALRKRLMALLIALVITGAIVFLAGSRGGWVSYIVACCALLAYFLRHGQISKAQVTAGAAMLAILVVVLVWQYPHSRARMENTLGIFSADLQKIDAATSHRVTIWKVARNMISVHPINGVGVGGFRYAYPAYAEPGDRFVDGQTGVGAFYAHQLLIEVLSETGLIGVAGLLLLFWLWWKSWSRADAATRERIVPFGVAVLAWMFPFNTHASFYGPQWAQLIWLLLALYCAGLSHQAKVKV